MSPRFRCLFCVSIVLVVALCQECEWQQCFRVTTDSDPESVYANATQAFEAASLVSSAEVQILSVSHLRVSLGKLSILTDVEFRVSANCLDVTETIRVSVGGRLLVDNATIEGKGETVGFEVEGTLELMNCTLNNWQSTVIQVDQGWLLIDSSFFIGLISKIIALNQQSEIYISDTVFSDNSAEILATPQHSVSPSNVTVSRCEFTNNTNSILFRAAFFQSDSASLITITECDFENNLGLLFDFRLESVSILIENCTFQGNSAGGLALRQQGGSTRVTSCSWVNNDSAFVRVTLLVGTLLIDHSLFSFQHSSAPVQIDNTGDPSSCRTIVTTSVFSNSSILPMAHTAAALLVQQCVATLSDSRVENCTAFAPFLSQAFSAVFIFYGSLEVTDTVFVSSGGSGALITFFLSTGVLKNVRLLDPILGSDGVVTVVGSVIQAQRLEVNGGDISHSHRITAAILLYFFLEVSSLHLDDFVFEHSSLRVDAVITACYSNVTASRLRVSHIASSYLITQIQSRVSISTFACDYCSFDFVSESAGVSKTDYENVTLTHSVIRSSIIITGSGGNIAFQNWTLREVDIKAAIQGSSCTVEITAFRLFNSRVTAFITNFLLSTAVLRSLEYHNTTGALVQAYSSDVLISESYFDAVTTTDFAVSLQHSQLTVNQTQFELLVSEGFATVIHDSSLRLTEVSIGRIVCTGAEIVKMQTGSLRVVGTTISNFNASLFACDHTSVTIDSSAFRNGGFAEKTKIGPLTLLGGVLRCTDCSEIRISRVEFTRISAQLGGALYLVSLDAPSVATISDSDFANCSASAGGAIFLTNVSFKATNSVFHDCAADQSGGAVDCNLSEEHSWVIARSNFTSNRAREGGAIKWRGAGPKLIAVVFEANEAVYGPEIASYGVNLSGSLTGNVAPGQPLRLKYSLLDHYEKEVLTANSEMVVLVPSESLTYRGITSKIAVNGTFDFTGISVLTAPESSAVLTAVYRWSGADYSLTFANSMKAQFRNCLPGEIRRKDSCVYCESGYYSLIQSDTTCRLCLETALCPGGAELVPRKDAWLTGIPSNPILSCPIPDTCDGGLNNSCATGYSHKLCNHCSTNWFSVVFFNCSECPPQAVVWLELALFVFIFILILCGFHSLAILAPDPDRLLALKVLLSHVQYLALLAFVKKRYSNAMRAFLRVMLTIGSLHAASFPSECLEKEYFFNIGVAASTGIVSLCLSGCVVWLRRLFEKSRFSFCGEMGRMAVLVSPLVMVAVAMATLPMFSCMDAGDDEAWLVIDMSEKCWSGVHKSFLQVAVLPACLLNLLLPLFAILVSFLKPDIPSVYTSPAWALLFLAFQLLCVISVVSQLANTPLSQVYLGVLSLYPLLILNKWFNIYTKLAHLHLTEMSLFLLAGSYSLVMYCTEYHTDDGETVASVIFIAINAGFLLLCMRMTFHHRRPRSPTRLPAVHERHSPSELLVPSSTLELQSINLELSSLTPRASRIVANDM